MLYQYIRLVAAVLVVFLLAGAVGFSLIIN